jgi:hypothetical protein
MEQTRRYALENHVHRLGASVLVRETWYKPTRSVTMAPQNAPRSGVAAALPSTVRSAEPASVFKPPVMTVMPSKKKPTPPRIEIVIDIRALLGGIRYKIA